MGVDPILRVVGYSTGFEAELLTHLPFSVGRTTGTLSDRAGLLCPSNGLTPVMAVAHDLTRKGMRD